MWWPGEMKRSPPPCPRWRSASPRGGGLQRAAPVTQLIETITPPTQTPLTRRAAEHQHLGLDQVAVQIVGVLRVQRQHRLPECLAPGVDPGVAPAHMPARSGVGGWPPAQVQHLDDVARRMLDLVGADELNH